MTQPAAALQKFKVHIEHIKFELRQELGSPLGLGRRPMAHRSIIDNKSLQECTLHAHAYRRRQPIRALKVQLRIAEELHPYALCLTGLTGSK